MNLIKPYFIINILFFSSTEVPNVKNKNLKKVNHKNSFSFQLVF